ncbi:unnamed protein product [Urochloa decumbens]|uniref:F-box domain-containing protein n=1 Tax=Urochloa decumbens TaxID=240449 RepID=A0ABC8WB41_9POAL
MRCPARLHPVRFGYRPAMALAALPRDADYLANNNDGVLPSDVLYEVLLHLPAKALCRLRLVCRSWRSLTSDPRFARAHSARHPLFIVVDLDRVESEIHIIDLYSGSIVKRISSADLAQRVHGIGDLYRLMSTEASLVCVSTTTSDDGSVQDIVLNPTTGAVKILPDGNRSGLVNSCILGYVPSTGEYKVLRLCFCATPEETFEVACEVIALGGCGDEQRWRAKPSPEINISAHFRYVAVVHGVAYFCSFKSSDDDDDDDDDDTMPSIALFDLATEKWRPSTLPGPIRCHLYHLDADQIHFNSFDGCLLVISHHKVRDCSTDLWFLMGVDNNSPSWTKRYSMRCAPHWDHAAFYPPCPLVMLGDGRVVAWLKWKYVLTVYDPSTGTSGIATMAIVRADSVSTVFFSNSLYGLAVVAKQSVQIEG